MLLRHVGAQVVQGVAHFADHVADVGAELFEGRTHHVAAAVALHDAIELEGEVGERLADPVVQVPGDPGAFLLRADGSEAGKPASVVEGERGGLGESRQQLDIALGEVVGVGVLERHEPDHRAAGEQHGVDAGVHARREAGAARDEQVGLGHRAPLGHGHGERRWEVVDTDPRRQAGALAASDEPPAVGIVEEQDGGRRELEQIAQAAHGRVEGFVEVERRGQRLGHAVQREQQRVGVGEAAQTVERQRLLPVGLAGDAPGVARHQRDEDHPRGPLRGQAQLVVVVADVVRKGHRHDRYDGDQQ